MSETCIALGTDQQQLTSDFNTFLQKAWQDHAAQPQAVSQRCADALGMLTDGTQASALARLVVHVMGEHLGDWAAARHTLALLGQVPLVRAHAPAQRAVLVAQAALELAQALPLSMPLGELERLDALCSASAVALGRGGDERASGLFTAALTLAEQMPPEQTTFHRLLAVAANNLAVVLSDRADLAPAQVALMLCAAQAARTYWEKAGTWLEVERAEYRLARCHVRAGQPGTAQLHAQTCLSICQAQQAPAFELFFAQAMLAELARAGHDSAAFQQACTAAQQAFEQLDAQDQTDCRPDLQSLMQAA